MKLQGSFDRKGVAPKLLFVKKRVFRGMFAKIRRVAIERWKHPFERKRIILTSTLIGTQERHATLLGDVLVGLRHEQLG